MSQLAVMLAPFALLFAAAGGPGIAVDLAPDGTEDHARTVPGTGSDWLSIRPGYDIETAHQVRMERRIILRISPRPMPPRSEFFDNVDPEPVRMVERAGPRCLPVRDIVGTADQGRRLVLFLRHDRIMVADLAKGCSARDFYRGFYLERSEDGQMCSGRDVLLARSGAKCELKGLRELVPVR